MPSNPFTSGRPVFGPGRFAGRQTELNQVVDRLLSVRFESVSVVGERRIGKTSLLKHLAEPDVAASLGLDPEEYTIVFVDLEGSVELNPDRFWKRVLKMLHRSVSDSGLVDEIKKLEEGASVDFYDLEDLLDSFENAGRKVLLLLDEFECVSNNPNFGEGFFSGMRSLATLKPLALVTASTCGLEQLCHSEEIKTSPFFNIFGTVVLPLFTRFEALELLEINLQGAPIQFSPEDCSWVLELGSGHPLFLQMAGGLLYAAKASGLSGPALQDHLIRYFDQRADSQFFYLWGECTESQRITLLTVMALSRADPKKPGLPPPPLPSAEEINRSYARSGPDLDRLMQRGLLMQEGGRYALISSRLDEWIEKELKSSPDEENGGELDSWLKGGGIKDAETSRTLLGRIKHKYWSLITNCTSQVVLGVAGNATYAFLTSLIK